jgi:hypothetical protein
MRPARTAIRRDALPSSLAGRWREHPRRGLRSVAAGRNGPSLPGGPAGSSNGTGTGTGAGAGVAQAVTCCRRPLGPMASSRQLPTGGREPDRGPAGPRADSGQSRGCRPARRPGDHLAAAGAKHSTPQRTCVLMRKASQRVRQYVLINSMSQASLSARSRSYDAFAHARRAVGTAPGRSTGPPGDLFTPSELPIGGVCAARTGRRWRPTPRRSRPVGRRRAAAGSSALRGPPWSPGAVPDHGTRLTAGRAPGPNVTARAPC